MKKSDKIKLYIYNNYWKAIGVILFIASLFVYSTEYIELLNFSLVNPIMSRLECFAYPIVAFVAILIYYIFIGFKIKKQSLKRLIFILIATIIYLCCISSNKWECETIYGANKLFAYANVLLLIPTLEIVILIRNIVSAKRKDIEAPYFECEYPLEKDESLLDKYNRFPFFKNLASKRLNSSFSKKGAFAMSIVGTWGSGKSTAMNIIKGEFENKPTITIDFQPWRSTSFKNIIRDFIVSYKNAISPYIPELSSKLDDYLHILLKSFSSDVPLVKFLSEISRPDNSLASQYDIIKNLLLKSKLKVVVFIDDLDRLEYDELMEVLKIIRNTANFPYTIFVAAYDKEHIVSVMKDKISRPPHYLEKIFNLEIPLPKYEDYETRNSLLEKLKETYGDEENVICPIGFKGLIEIVNKDDIVAYMEKEAKRNNGTSKKYTPQYNLISAILRTNRDVIRFFNSFKLIYDWYQSQETDNDIYFADLFYLELLRYRFKNIYDILRDAPLELLELNGSNDEFYHINISEKDLEDIVGKNTHTPSCVASDLMLLLFNNKNPYMKVNNEEIGGKALIPEYDSFKRINCKFGLSRYFSWNLSPKNLSGVEFSEILPLNEFNKGSKKEKILISWFKEKHKEEIKHRLSNNLNESTSALITKCIDKETFKETEITLINTYKFFKSCLLSENKKIKYISIIILERFFDFPSRIFCASYEQFEELLNLIVLLKKESDISIRFDFIFNKLIYKSSIREVYNSKILSEDINLDRAKIIIIKFLEDLAVVENIEDDFIKALDDKEKLFRDRNLTNDILLITFEEIREIISKECK